MFEWSARPKCGPSHDSHISSPGDGLFGVPSSLTRQGAAGGAVPHLTLEKIGRRTDDLGEGMSDLSARVEDLAKRTQQLHVQTGDIMKQDRLTELSKRVEMLEGLLARSDMVHLLSRWADVERRIASVATDTEGWQRQYEIKMKPHFAGLEVYHREKAAWEKRFVDLEQRMGDLESDSQNLLRLGLHAESPSQWHSVGSPSPDAWLSLAKDADRMSQELEKVRSGFEHSQHQLDLLQTKADESAKQMESLTTNVYGLVERIHTVDVLGDELQAVDGMRQQIKAVDTACREIGGRLEDLISKNSVPNKHIPSPSRGSPLKTDYGGDIEIEGVLQSPRERIVSYIPLRGHSHKMYKMSDGVWSDFSF